MDNVSMGAVDEDLTDGKARCASATTSAIEAHLIASSDSTGAKLQRPAAADAQPAPPAQDFAVGAPGLTVALAGSGNIPGGGTVNGTVTISQALQADLNVAIYQANIISSCGTVSFSADSVKIPKGQTVANFTVTGNGQSSEVGDVDILAEDDNVDFGETTATVYSLVPTLTPDDNFAGRSVTTLGLCETGGVGFTMSPPWVTVASLGGLSWTASGSCVIKDNQDGTGTFSISAVPGTMTATLAVTAGPNAGQTWAITRTVEGPSGANTVHCDATGMPVPAGQDLNHVRHGYGYIGAGFKSLIYLLPADVSFSNLFFYEGTVPAQASGIYLSQNGVMHPQTLNGVAISAGNSTSGCRVEAPDTVDSADVAYNGVMFNETGDFLWPIPWCVESAAQVVIPVCIANHHKQSSATGVCTLSKVSLSFAKNALDATCGF